MTRLISLRNIFPLVFLAAIITAPPVAAVPSPKAVPARPEMTFREGPLRIHQSRQDGKWYWYMPYTVENRTGEDQIWAPRIVLFTDQGGILSAGKNVPSDVEDELLDHLQSPLLEPQYKVIGEIKQGAGNARSGLLIWPAPRTDVNEMALFVTGLSPETEVVRHPRTGKEIVLRKTLKRSYLIPGDITMRGGVGSDQRIMPHPDYPDVVWVFR